MTSSSGQRSLWRISLILAFALSLVTTVGGTAAAAPPSATADKGKGQPTHAPRARFKTGLA
jgi:hypothetical protein